jgi:hypothetical protein
MYEKTAIRIQLKVANSRHTFCRKAGLPDVYFQTKNPNFGKLWRALRWKKLVFFMAILSILRPNGIFYSHLVHFVVIWYIFSRFGMLY